MGVKAGSKRRSLHEKVAKLGDFRQKVVQPPTETLALGLLHRLLKSSRRRKFYPFGYLFYFSPLKVLENGTFVLASVKRRLVFYTLSVLFGAVFFYRTHILVGYLNQNGLDLIGVLSSMYVLAMFASACCYYGVLCDHEDMKQLLNQSHPPCMRQVCGLENGTFSTLSFWLKRTSFSGMISTVVLDATLFSLFFDGVPVCVYPSLKAIIPSLDITAFAGQVGFYPLEVLSVAPPFVPALISLITTVIGLTQMKDYVEKSSKRTVRNLKDWKRLERGYRCALLYNQILIPWLKNAAAPMVVAAMFGMIGSSYVTLTSIHRLPFVIYILFPVSFVATMGMFTLACMDAVNTKTNADNVMVSLRARGNFFRFLSLEEKKEFLLRCRAIKPILLPIGSFTDISLNVPVYVFEEVLNQLLFLLAF